MEIDLDQNLLSLVVLSRFNEKQGVVYSVTARGKSRTYSAYLFAEGRVEYSESGNGVRASCTHKKC
jgi:hypothetical protein